MANWTRRKILKGHAARFGGRGRAAVARFFLDGNGEALASGAPIPDPLRHLVLGLRHQRRALDS